MRKRPEDVTFCLFSIDNIACTSLVVLRRDYLVLFYLRSFNKLLYDSWSVVVGSFLKVVYVF